VKLLDPHTVNQISAGEVVERPSSVVKELVENSLDAGASHITIELEDAGRTLIRVSDDGMGMVPFDAVAALGRHATSKIAAVEDLLAVRTLGFRGEALPSIASVSRFTLTTRPRESSSGAYGSRIVVAIEGGDWLALREPAEAATSGSSNAQVEFSTTAVNHRVLKVKEPAGLGQAWPETLENEEAEIERRAALLPRQAGPPGTTITVEDLFFNTPARLKFLKRDTTELGVALDVISRLAVAYPRVAFKLIHNGQIGLETTGDGDALEALAQIWSRDLARALVEVDVTVRGIRLRGFVSPPYVTKPNRSYQYVSVNGRFVRSRALTAALDVAYRELTPERRFPVVCLALQLDPARLDVNVSPTKTEVRFEHEGDAFEALRVGIRSALLEHGMMPSAAGIAQANDALRALETPRPVFDPHQPPRFGQGLIDRDLGPLSLAAQARLGTRPEGGNSPSAASPFTGNAPLPNLANSETACGMSALSSGPLESGAIVYGSGTPERTLDEERFPFAALLDGLRVIGQAMNTFIIAETNRGLIVVDQHVAHERVLYEWLCGLKGNGKVERQTLLIPQTIELERREAVLVADRLGELEAVGFELEPFGRGSFVVRAAPAALSQMTGKRQDPIKVLRNLIEELVDGETTGKIVTTREQIWITASCKMAVKAGDPLSLVEMEKLLLDLATTENPYLCPHGRPITATLTNSDLLRLFKRT
jgi:DNA mismatch repair protein MutL